MKYLNYDETTGEIKGFYTPEIHSAIPEPNIEITEEIWQNLIANGGKYKVDVEALEIVEKPPYVPTNEELLTAIRAKRDRFMNETSWIFQRQLTGPEAQKLSETDYQAWLDYWAALRDFPKTCDPDNPIWPAQPEN